MAREIHIMKELYKKFQVSRLRRLLYLEGESGLFLALVGTPY
jgi:hypothetical protein